MSFSEDFLYFSPIYQTRVWGGRTLETELKRSLPDPDQPYGESWDVSARPEADSIVAEGSLAGRSLMDLWADRELRTVIFGEKAPDQERFPLLCKVLDARDKLSIQVHPPDAVAEDLGGEPKTEMWYVAAADPGAVLYVGLPAGVGREQFEAALENGSLEDCVHPIYPKAGEYIFIPSGRLHAIGGGLLIYEIQQNSDTTFRVYDWNRLGLDGNPRELHVAESMQCIDFEDVEPTMDTPEGNIISYCSHFQVEHHEISNGDSLASISRGRFGILTVVSGALLHNSGRKFGKGDFVLLPPSANAANFAPEGDIATLLLTTWPEN